MDVVVEKLEFGEKGRVGKVAVQYPDRILRVIGGYQRSASFADRLHVTGGDIAGGAEQGKAGHGDTSGPHDMGGGFAIDPAAVNDQRRVIQNHAEIELVVVRGHHDCIELAQR